MISGCAASFMKQNRNYTPVLRGTPDECRLLGPAEVIEETDWVRDDKPAKWVKVPPHAVGRTPVDLQKMR